MKRTLLLIGVLAVAALAAVWLAERARPPVPTAVARLSVAATFYPLAEAARSIGGDRVEVVTLTPPGAEPHDFEPTPKDVALMSAGDVFLMNGGIDAWGDRLIPDLKTQGVIVARMQDDLPEIARDPHVWLDPVRAELIAAIVRDALIEADPAGAESYRLGAVAYRRELADLDRAYASGLASCGSRTVFTSHDALGYLAARYGFTAVPIAGLSPDEEPSPKRLAEIATQAKAAGAKHIFFETLVSPKLAETIASEIGASALVFDPAEGISKEASSRGEDYFSIMRSNLEALKTAMLCR